MKVVCVDAGAGPKHNPLGVPCDLPSGFVVVGETYTVSEFNHNGSGYVLAEKPIVIRDNRMGLTAHWDARRFVRQNYYEAEFCVGAVEEFSEGGRFIPAKGAK